MLDSAGQPRRQQLCQPLALCPCPVSPPRVIRADFSLLIRPCGSSIAHCATVTQLVTVTRWCSLPGPGRVALFPRGSRELMVPQDEVKGAARFSRIEPGAAGDPGVPA